MDVKFQMSIKDAGLIYQALAGCPPGCPGWPAKTKERLADAVRKLRAGLLGNLKATEEWSPGPIE